MHNINTPPRTPRRETQNTCIFRGGGYTEGGGLHERKAKGKGNRLVLTQPGASAMASTSLGKVPGCSLGMWVIRVPTP